MLTLTFLGVGSAFAKRNLNSNALIEAWSAGPDQQDAPDDNLLVDFGVTGPLALYRLKDEPRFEYLRRGTEINYPAIRRVFITHVHSDHIGGLEELAWCALHAPRPAGERPRGPELLLEERLVDRLWERSLSGGLGVLNGREARLEDYFRVTVLSARADVTGFTLLDRYDVRVFPTDHIRIRRPHDWPSFGLVITDRSTGDSAMYSGDTRLDARALGPMMEAASIIFHEVELTEVPGTVHAPLSALAGLPAGIRAKMRLYHYGDQWDDPAYASVERDFAGFAVARHRYTLLD